MTTLIMTAKLNDVDPQAWLTDVLARIVARHGKLPPRRHEELPPPWIAEERANERGTNHGKPVVE